MSYYEQVGGVGLLNLNTFDMMDLKIRTNNEDGTLSTGFTMVGSKKFAEGISARYIVIPERSYTVVDINVSGKDKYVDFEKLSKHLCQDCINTVYNMEKPWNNETPLTLVFIDLRTREIHSMASCYPSYAISDYMVFLSHNGDKKEAIVVYSPKE